MGGARKFKGPFLHVEVISHFSSVSFKGEKSSKKSSGFTASRGLFFLNPSEFEEREFRSQKAITLPESNIAPETLGLVQMSLLLGFGLLSGAI